MFDYTMITQDTIEDLTSATIATCERLVAGVVAIEGERTFTNTLLPLEEAATAVALAYGRGPFLSNVHPDESIRTAARASEEALTKWQVGLTFRRDLYEAISAYAETEDAASLSGEHRRLLDFTTRDFRRAGHELEQAQREELERLQNRMVELGIAFEKNIADVDAALIVTRSDLAGMTDDYVGRLQPGPDAGTYKVTMAYPDVFPFMENATRRDLRERLLFLFSTRAVDANRPILEEAVRLREKMAAMFGLPSWADYRMEVKMAKRPKAVTTFYDDLVPPLTEIGNREIAVLASMLESEAGDPQLQPWDRRYYDTQLRKRDYGVDQTRVAQYFPLDRVIDGLLSITGEVFGLEYRKRGDVPTWHPDVVVYDIVDASSGEQVATFMADLFPREGKFSHAAAFPLVPGHRKADGEYQLPLSVIVANFTKPSADVPSLLQHSEVETLFHEFGHILHMSLGHTEFTRFSGASTEWDFVEAPSQIMEEWCWRANVLQRFARHHETGEPIPTDLVDKLVAARHVNEALDTLRQVSLGKLDLGLHGPGDHRDLDAIMLDAESVGLLPHQEGTFFPASFGHLLGGYDAGYYGYLWSKVFGLDMFSRFEEAGVTNPDVGLAYRRKILERGGSRDAADLMRDFLGREPNNEAFLRHLGLTGALGE
ncbi:oligopeptidase A [bacterium BMS3Abin02]|nr:oligopeptidase A [bacterium BMS3Abin02]